MHMRDGVFATNGEGALTCMRCDTTSRPLSLAVTGGMGPGLLQRGQQDRYWCQ